MSNDSPVIPSGPNQDANSDMKMGAWTDERKPRRRNFPSRTPVGAVLRASFTAAAYTDLTQHTKESLKAEICGVLVGNICSDDHGLWVEVIASLRGSAASHGSAHVTFTQETWKQIHSDLERLHPKLHIVGWYHSHPGFGVTFSEMDAFIHRNFFSGPGQIALVADPLSGEDAICCNTESGISYLENCLVDGRERTLKRPASLTNTVAPTSEAVGGERIAALETRITQLVTSLDDMRERAWHFNLLIGMIVVFAVVMFIGWQIWNARVHEQRPPEPFQEITIPLRIGDKDVRLFAHIYKWEIPTDLRTDYRMMLEIALEKQLADEKRKAEELLKAKKDSPPSEHGDVAPPSAPPTAPHPTGSP